ncbi:MAG: C4-dicarboxylate ABC transporter substrate-binding protein, partial [Pseudomonadota bacterium]
MSMKLFAALAASVLVTTSADAQTVLSAETAAPNTTPGISIISLSEAAAKEGVADVQVASGQTLTNSVQNV